MSNKHTNPEKTESFYDVKSRAKVDVPAADCRRVRYGAGAKVRHALRGRYAGRWLTRFVSKGVWETCGYEEAEVSGSSG